MKHLLAITIALLPSAALAQQFTPKQLIEVMTKSPDNRDVRVHDLIRLGLSIDDDGNIVGEDEDDHDLPDLDGDSGEGSTMENVD